MLTLTLFLLLIATGAAVAQVLEAGVGAGVNRISNRTLEEPVVLKDGWRLNLFRFTLNPYPHFGFEAGYSYVRTNWDVGDGQTFGTATHQGHGTALAYLVSEGSRVRPFVAGGVQFSNFIFPGYSVSSGGGSTKLGVNYGGGVKVRVAEHFLIRFDFRQYLSPKPDFGLSATGPQGWLRMNEISTGFSYCL